METAFCDITLYKPPKPPAPPPQYNPYYNKFPYTEKQFK